LAEPFGQAAVDLNDQPVADHDVEHDHDADVDQRDEKRRNEGDPGRVGEIGASPVSAGTHEATIR
jgi:hypothetical protein